METVLSILLQYRNHELEITEAVRAGELEEAGDYRVIEKAGWTSPKELDFG